MKARKIAILLFIFTSAIVNPAYMVDNIQEDPSMIDTPYEFPVVPGTDDWAELDSLEEKLEVSQIPDDLLEKLRQHRTIAEASAVESPIRQETIGFPAHFFARAHNFKPPGRACQPEADSPMRT